MNGLLTDLYELTMAAGFFEAGRTSEIATFELTLRRLPKDRTFVVVAGLEQAVDYLLNLGFTGEEIGYLRKLPVFSKVSAGFFEALRDFRFTGDVLAVPEGTPMFAGEPVLILRAPLMEAQIPETYLLAAITFQTLIATKAARIVDAADGRPVVEFGTRRAHTAEAGVLGARAAYIGGCLGTSNTLAGFRFGVPVFGTAAHSWIMSFPTEMEAFARLQQVLGEHTVQLIDTYDSLEGARRVASLGRPLWGVRIDSGDFIRNSRQVREILDESGLRDVKIMASGDLNEYKIRDLLAAGAPIDSFGVGTELATSADAPAMGSIYKMVELQSGGEKRYTAKFSEEKSTLPGAKQVFRYAGRDVLARSSECHKGSEALLRPVIIRGRLVEDLPDAAAARANAAQWLRRIPREPLPVERSSELDALAEDIRRSLR